MSTWPRSEEIDFNRIAQFMGWNYSPRTAHTRAFYRFGTIKEILRKMGKENMHVGYLSKLTKAIFGYDLYSAEFTKGHWWKVLLCEPEDHLVAITKTLEFCDDLDEMEDVGPVEAKQ